MKQLIGNVLFGVGAFMMISMAPVIFSGRDFSFLPIILAAFLAAVGSFLRGDGAADSKDSTLPSTGQSDGEAINTGTLGPLASPDQSGGLAEKEYDEAVLRGLEGDFDTAGSHAEKALHINPCYEPAQHLDRILVDLKGGLISQEAAKWIFSGTDLGNKNRLAEATKCFSQAIATSPSYALFYAQRGVFVARTGDHVSAIADFDRALALEPSVAGLAAVYSAKGYSEAALGQTSNALTTLTKAIELCPRSPFAYATRGTLYLNSGMTDKACSDFKQAAEFGLPQNYALVKAKGLCK